MKKYGILALALCLALSGCGIKKAATEKKEVESMAQSSEVLSLNDLGEESTAESVEESTEESIQESTEESTDYTIAEEAIDIDSLLSETESESSEEPEESEPELEEVTKESTEGETESTESTESTSESEVESKAETEEIKEYKKAELSEEAREYNEFCTDLGDEYKYTNDYNGRQAFKIVKQGEYDGYNAPQEVETTYVILMDTVASGDNGVYMDFRKAYPDRLYDILQAIMGQYMINIEQTELTSEMKIVRDNVRIGCRIGFEQNDKFYDVFVTVINNQAYGVMRISNESSDMNAALEVYDHLRFNSLDR